MQNNTPITLSQFQQMLGQTVRMNPNLQGVWVVAELSDVRIAGGHCYMELIEKDATGVTVAKTRAMIWSGTLSTLRRKFYHVTGKDISTGMKVMVKGSANHHNLYGLSFTISDIDPSYTIGDLERLRREILERLMREGVLNLNKELPFPPMPQKIAVISSGGAAGYGDFINQLAGNAEGFKFYPMLFPAIMQGDRTAPSVIAALDKIELAIDFWDCVVIIRGGGSTTDLNGFDDYELAKKVATYPLPVIVGIGHERDRNVLDEIACVRCKTPTAVASALCDRLRVSYSRVVDSVRRIAKYSGDSLKGEQHRLVNIESSVPAIARTRLLQASKRLDGTAHQLERAVSKRFSVEDRNISLLKMRYANALKSITEKPMLRLKNIENMLRVLSPSNTLKRGYSITRINGKAVRDAAKLENGALIETYLSEGSIISEVKGINK